eukprot:TRINITY_DN11231_c0_g1_i1.p1 TRINITY_DN11231_c0_g1~~TRINITY_DN11231_c0_g1_i1.p1  ORF type:complete len:556 (+),score=146.39 TRINITY_DN11231_c0_g1_i1:57-1724(+)
MYLVAEDGSEIELGEQDRTIVLGRGNHGIMDKKCSRTHMEVAVRDERVFIKAIGVNASVIIHSDEPRQLTKGEEVEMFVGDTIQLLIGSYPFTLKSRKPIKRREPDATESVEKKRRVGEDGPAHTEDQSWPLPPCPYGEKCYRENPAHKAQFSHPRSNVNKPTQDEPMPDAKPILASQPNPKPKDEPKMEPKIDPKTIEPKKDVKIEPKQEVKTDDNPKPKDDPSASLKATPSLEDTPSPLSQANITERAINTARHLKVSPVSKSFIIPDLNLDIDDEASDAKRPKLSLEYGTSDEEEEENLVKPKAAQSPAAPKKSPSFVVPKFLQREYSFSQKPKEKEEDKENAPPIARNLQVQNNNNRTLAFPSISTGSFQFPAQKAASIACDILSEFLAEHQDDALLRVILVEPEGNNAVLKEFQRCSPRDARFQIRSGDITHMKTTLEMARFICNECNWRLRPGGSEINRRIFQVAGDEFIQSTKERHPRPANPGGVYPVPVPDTSPLHTDEGVDWVLHCLGPNLNPNRPDYIKDEAKAEDLLKKCYRNLFQEFYTLATQ